MGSGYQYDVFISHAVEDKIPIANELFRSLEQRNLKVWYSGRELSVGDRLTESIHKSLDQCRFGVVIISPTYLSKIWALNEFFYLLTKEKYGQKVILPVLYDITPEQLASRSTLMAEIFAVRADLGIDRVTEILHREIEKQRQQEKETEKPLPNAFLNPNLSKKRIAPILLSTLLAIAGVTAFLHYGNNVPQKGHIYSAIEKRITDLQHTADASLKHITTGNNAKPASPDDIKQLYTDYINAKSYYRNEYILDTGIEVLRSKKKVNARLALDMDSISPLNQYNLHIPDIYRWEQTSTNQAEFIYYNTEPVHYHLQRTEDNEGHYEVMVTYTNPLRLIQTTLEFPKLTTDIKRRQVTITALPPTETFLFVLRNNEWVVEQIK